MKKTLIALAALAATGAFAQVSVYGRLDAGYAQTTNTAWNGTANVDTKANGVQSHNSVSSMWGIKGSEDLGGGLKANFTLEQDVYPADGNTGVSGAAGGTGNAAGFNRTSLLGLSGGFGSIAFGRDYVPTFKLVAATDVNSLSRISTVQLAAASGNSTQPNLVIYNSPNMSGFQLNVAYGNQDSTVSTATGDTSTKVTNVTATYANGPLMVGVGTGTTEVKANGAPSGSFLLSGYTVIAAGVEKTTGTVLAASYDFGKFALKGNVINQKVTAGATEVKLDEVNIGATVPMGKVTLVAQAGSNKADDGSGGDALTGTDFVIGADYALSAKTALFAKTGNYNKWSSGAVEFKSTSTAVGIKTVF